MSTYGMSAKDRMAMFQQKSASETNGTKAGPKKIGKLNIGGPAAKKEPAKKAPVKKLTKKAEEKKEDPKTKTKIEEPKPEPKKEVKKEEPKKEESKQEPKKEDTKKQEPKKKETKKEETKKEPKSEPKKEEPKPEPKKEEPKPEPKKEEPKPKPKKEEPKPEPKKEEPKPEPKKQEPMPEPKKEEPKPELKKEQPKPEPKKEEAKPELKKEIPTTEMKQQEPKMAHQQEASKAGPKQEASKAGPKQAPKKEDAQTPKKEEATKPEPTKQPEAKQEAPKAEPQKSDAKLQAKQTAPKSDVKEAPKAPAKQEPQKKVEPKQPAPKEALKTDKTKPEPKKEPTKAPAPVAEEPIDVVVVERKPKVAPNVALPEDEPLPEVKAVVHSAPAEEVKPQALSTEVVEEVIEVQSLKKGETVPAIKPEPKPVMKTIKPMKIAKPADNFYNTIFYFSGMGSVVGSSLSKGIYVPNQLTRTSLDADVIEKLENYKPVEQKRRDTVVESARAQATDLTDELKKLRALLFGLPSWGNDSNEGVLDPSSIQRIGGEAPQQMAQPWQETHQGVNLISQAHSAMAQDLPPPKLMPAPNRPAHRQLPPPAPVQEAPVQAVADPLALANATRAAATKRQPEARAPPKGGVNMYGVFQADVSSNVDNRPWQERYGSKPAPRIGGGELDSKGLKPWQASRLRGLEARGYEFKRPPPKTGADFAGDAFCGTKATIEIQKEDDISSYTPYLVSGKTRGADMRKLLQEGGVESDSYSYGISQTYGGGTQLPYCDL